MLPSLNLRVAFSRLSGSLESLKIVRAKHSQIQGGGYLRTGRQMLRPHKIPALGYAMGIPLILAVAGCSRKPPPRQIRQVVSGPGAALNVTCSSDGKALAFQLKRTGRDEIWVAPASGGDPKPLTEGRSPAWSPDGMRLAFESTRSGNSDIYVISAGGGAPAQVTRDPAADWAPRWSPDGRWIAFASNRQDSVAIWATTLAGDRVVRVSRAGGANPAWSPDSRWIAYQARSPDGNWDLYLSEVERGRIIRLTSGGGADLDPAWSPDGKRIAFRALLRDGADICVIPADGGTPVRLTRNAGADAPPAWSPDGKRIAFISYAAWTSIAVAPADGGEGITLFRGLMEPSALSWHPSGDRLLFCARSADLWTVPAGGGPAARLTNDLFEDRKPDVSPDGRRIVFESNRDGNPGLWTLDAAGNPRLLLPHPAVADAHPRFSPDGKRIAFASNREETDRQTDIWTVSSDGSNPRRMTSIGGLKGRPTWFSDNARIVFESNLNGGWGLWALEPSSRVVPVIQKKPSMRPAWSPDGWWLAYQSERNSNQDIYLTQMKTGEERRLTANPAREGDPAWSRDGKRIAFVSDRAGTDDIYAMPASGEGPEVQLTSGPEDDIEPAWFPDGGRIAFVRIAPQSVWSITAP